MMSSDFNSPTRLRGDRKTRLDTAVDPGAYLTGLDPTVWGKAEDRRPLTSNEFFDRQPFPGLGIVYECGRNYALTHPRPGSNNDQIGLLEASRLGIQVVEPAWHAGDDRLVLVDLLDLVPGRLEDVLEGDEVLRDAAFRDVEDHTLRGVQRLVCRGALVEAECGDAPAGADQLTFRARFFDQVPVVLDIGGGRYAALELGQERLPADPFEDAHLLQLGRECQQVDGIGAVVQVQRGPVDLRVMVQIEVLRTEEVGHPNHGVAIEHQRTEHRRLGLQVVRRHAATGRRRSRRAPQVNRQAEVTISGIRAVTSRWSFTCALPGPIALTGSSNSIFRRSSVMPCCCLSADATSALVTAPNSLPSFPLRSFKTTWAASSRTARALASDSSRCSRWTVVDFCRSTCSCAPRVAGWASLRGIRKFRAKPSATSFVSPALPVPFTSWIRTTFTARRTPQTLAWHSAPLAWAGGPAGSARPSCRRPPSSSYDRKPAAA